MRVLAFKKDRVLYEQVMALGEDKNSVLNLLKNHEPLF